MAPFLDHAAATRRDSLWLGVARAARRRSPGRGEAEGLVHGAVEGLFEACQRGPGHDLLAPHTWSVGQTDLGLLKGIYLCAHASMSCYVVLINTRSHRPKGALKGIQILCFGLILDCSFASSRVSPSKL